MRALWFSNTPSLAAKISNTSSVGGGWIESMEHEMKAYPDIDLGIVFTKLAKEPQEFVSEDSSTRYFMVPRHPYGKYDRWIDRLTVRPPSEKTLKEYLRIVDHFKPDVVLFFGTESDFPLIIPQLKVPSIVWYQGNLTVYERMYQNGIPLRKTLSNERLKDIIKGDSIYHDYLHYKLLAERERKIFSLTNNVIGRTTWDRRVVSILAPTAKYFHCDDPLRPPFFQDQWEQKKNRDKFVITTTIQGHLYKGLETVFEAAKFLSQILEKPIEWRVIGIPEGTAYVRTARRVTGFPVSNSSVTLLGFKTGSELLQELLNADLYAHPAHIENAPNAVQEAMLLGLPVVATNVGGTPTLLKDGKEGFLVQSKDPFAMAGAILELYRSPDKAMEFGKNARKIGLVRNDGKKISSDLIAIFEQLLSSNKKAPSPE